MEEIFQTEMYKISFIDQISRGRYGYPPHMYIIDRRQFLIGGTQLNLVEERGESVYCSSELYACRNTFDIENNG